MVSNSFNAILAKISSTQSWPAGFPNYVWSALMPLAGTPHDLYTQFLRKVSPLYSFVACLPFHDWFFQPSPLFISGLDKYWPVHCKCYTEQFNVMMPGGAPLRVAMDNSFLALEQFCLHQLCMHQHPSSSIGDELNYYLLLKTGVWNMTHTRVSPPLIYRHYTIYYNNYYDP